MKKLAIVLLLMPTIIITSACSMMKDTKTKVTKEVEELETEMTDDLDSMEKEAYEDVNKLEEIDKEQIKTAVNYIQEHINDPLESETVTKKLYYYASYIEAVANKKGINIDNDIYTLATNTKSYVSSLYRKEQQDTSDAMKTLKSSIDDIAKKLDDTKDDLIDGFYNLVK